ncbi:hypothetical protein SDC9_23972 [bioreactor metagenome]|uniref:Right handed beta helix domain-containing protein n=1 Tax=bioreactor metagenome TaxID=1076179 RepID=A0A644UGJ1_9ZZZZ|nr:hypothetical protein [Methanobrevibacter sp.]MEA4957722.1 hypothetical protein [Methanobrevibacter sp.]
MKIFKKITILLFILLMICTTISIVSASSITINNTNNTLKDVVNNYDTIYLDDGVYNGSMNKGINVTKNTTIIGLNKNLAIIDVGYGELFTVSNGSLTLMNLTIRNGHGSHLISNFRLLNVINTTFDNNRYGSEILSTGELFVIDSIFRNGFGGIDSLYGGHNITIKSTEFINNSIGGVHGLIHVSGFDKTLNLDNLTFVNNNAYDTLISIMADYISLKLSNSRFINNTIGSSDLFYISGPYSHPSVPHNKELTNIVEIGTMANINPYIHLNVHLKKNNLIVFKAILAKFGDVFSNKKLYFYVNGKYIGSALTNKNGIATFTIKRSNLNFNVQIVFKKYNNTTSARTTNINEASFNGSASKYVIGKSDIVLKLKNSKNKGKMVYRKYYIKNNGNSLGSETFNRKISSKYKLVKYSYKNVVFNYNKSKKSFSIKAKNLLPYKFNKKNLGILILVYKKK